MLIHDGTATRLQRVPFGSREYDEDWLQDLIFRHPELLPCETLDPSFEGMVAVAREFETGSGPVDVVLLNERGRVALVECKLWSNPEARRTVVAQVVDYAAAMSGWSTGRFEETLGKAKCKASETIREVFEDRGGTFDETSFLDGLADSLSRGRFLLLVVGDGIRRQVQDLANAVGSNPQLGFHLALIEIGLYRADGESDAPLVVVPEVVTKTREVTRAVVEVRVIGADAEVEASVPGDDDPDPYKRSPITESVFFERLSSTTNQKTEELARQILAQAGEYDLRIQWMEAGPVLKYDDEHTGKFFTFGQLSHVGELTNLSRLSERVLELGLPERIYTNYLDEIIALLPAAHRDTVISKSGRYERDEIIVEDLPGVSVGNIPLHQLVGSVEQWFQAIQHTISSIREETEIRYQ